MSWRRIRFWGIVSCDFPARRGAAVAVGTWAPAGEGGALVGFSEGRSVAGAIWAENRNRRSGTQ